MNKIVTSLLLFLVISFSAYAQLLNKAISINIDRQKLSVVLDKLSKEGGFIFSYNSDLIAKDSIVSVHASNKTIKQVLGMLLGNTFEYHQKKNYIIIQPLSQWEVTGYVMDNTTGEKLSDVSVYAPSRLVASLTNNEGYFKLKLTNSEDVQYITVRKMSYRDTSIRIKIGDPNELLIPISAREYVLDSVTVSNHKKVGDTWLGKMFLSSKEKIQSMNLAGYFVDKPYQVSVVPGIGTHGKMSSQVENKFSFNLLGGYSAGIDGVEIGSMFNLVKNNVDGVQVGGLFNVVGGKVNGIQISGLYNQSLDTVHAIQVAGLFNQTVGRVDGIQVAGVFNHSCNSAHGVQIAGVYNHTNRDLDFAQLAGVVNFSGGNTKGIQIAGVANITSKSIEGVQVSGVFNYAKHLKGVQIGLINYADSSSGLSIGLINIVPNGYHKLSVYTSELLQLNASFKSGTKDFYSILLGGFNPGDDKKVASFGYGLGSELSIAKWFSINPELSAQHLYLGDWNHANILSKASLLLSFKPIKHVQLFGGPTYNVYNSKQTYQNVGFLKVEPNDFNAHKIDDNTWGWIGWTAGISVF